MSRLLVPLVVTALSVSACQRPPLQEDVVARVGNATLSRDAVAEVLRLAGSPTDSADVAGRYVEQWVTDRLLEREAERRGLREDPAVRRQLQDAERSILVAALLDDVFAEAPESVDRGALQAYFESHRSSLRLLEPFVRVRHLAFGSAEAARGAQRLLAALDTLDTVRWRTLRSGSLLPDSVTTTYQDRFVPLSALFPTLPRLHAAVVSLDVGRTTGVVEDGGAWHVVRLVDRAETGSEPRLAWIEGSVRERVEIEARKQMVTRLVQTLRNEALAGRVLDMR